MALCGLLGAVNGSVISMLKVPPFIATLGMQRLIYGACLVYTGAIPIGGVGKITGILIGVLVFEVLKIVLQFLGVESSYTYIAQGLVIIIAVALDLRKYLAKK